MPQRDRSIMFAAAAVTATAAIVAALAGHAEAVAYLAPLCMVALPLLGGRFPGEATLERLRGRARPPRRRLPASSPAGIRRAAARFPRGGRLIAHALAERGPPAPALT